MLQVLSPPNYQYADMRDEDIVTGPTEKFDMDRYTERLTKLFKNGCQCKRRGCLDSLKYEDFYNNCLNFRKLPWKYQNYVLMGALNCGFTSSARCEAEKSLGVEEHDKHRGPKFVYFVLGQNVCRDVFCVFYGTSRRRIVWLSKNLREKGFLEVAHGNSCLSKSMKAPRKMKDTMNLPPSMLTNNPMQTNLMVQPKDMKNTNMNTNPLMYAPSSLQSIYYLLLCLQLHNIHHTSLFI